MTERPNIRRMQTPEKQVSKLRFDADKEITEKEWGSILANFNTDLLDAKRNHVTIGSKGQSILILKPGQELSISDSIYADLLQGIRDDITRRGVLSEHVAFTYNFLRAIGRPPPIPPEILDDFRKLIGTPETIVFDRIRAEAVVCLYAGDPSSITPKVIQYMRSDLKGLMNSEMNEDIDSAVALAAALRRIGQSVEIPNAFWTQCVQLLHIDKEGKNYNRFASVAANMKILAADEVIWTTKGTELVMHRANHEGNMPALPSTLEL